MTTAGTGARLVAAAFAAAVVLPAACAPLGRVVPFASREARGDLLAPDHAAFQVEAPATYHVRFETTRGDFLVEVIREWAPLGADRFYNLVRHGFYDGVRFFRVLDGFVAQFGMNGDAAVTAAWFDRRIPDDPVLESNVRGTLAFATSGRDTRTTQVFINYGDNSRLDAMGFAPFGRVTEGMEHVDALFSGYGEGAPTGRGPNQSLIRTQGNAYLDRDFPDLDRIVRARVVR